MRIKHAIYIYFNVIVFGLWGIIAFLGIMPQNPISLNKDLRKEIGIVFPERWCFFTKNPRDNYMLILQKTENGYKIHDNFPNSSSSNWFGLIYNQRAIGLEYGIISSKIDKNLWTKNNSGKSLLEVLKNDKSKTIKTKGYGENAFLKGEYVFVEIEPIPYAWKNKVDNFQMPSKYIKIKITGNE